MTHLPRLLDPRTLPLSGSQLVEASAGTGKTFTIAMVYLRLVLGHGTRDAAHPAGPLTPPQILVVTFTEAATKELRDRIRARLTQAARWFRQKPDHENGQNDTTPAVFDVDPALAALRADYPEHDWPQCARRLELAAEWMDEAAVSTIHGWCNRMLREHAFDSQSPFSQRLETDNSEQLAEAARDYWRTYYYPLEPELLRSVTERWPDPTALLDAIKRLLEQAAKLPDTADPAIVLKQNQEERARIIESLKAPWRTWGQEIRDILDQGIANKAVNGRALQARYVDSWCNALHDWAHGDAPVPKLSDTAFHRLTPEGLAEAWKTGPAPTHAAFEHMRTLPQALANLPDPVSGLLCHAAKEVAKNFTTALKRQAIMGFDDLLTGLDTALRGPNGERLAQVIRSQFPVALIDEFQDTDPVQYRIFDRVYDIAQNRADCGLILIGDPKQAIYAFRGADLFTYLKARRAVDDRIHTLATNFRSTTAMVEAVNACFELTENNPDSAGAFLFKTPEDNPIPFQPAHARGRTDTLLIDGAAPPALTLSVFEPAPAKGQSEDQAACSKQAYREHMAQACASRVAYWLARAHTQQAGFRNDAGAFKPLGPADIAILVNTGHEATLVRDALAARGVRSVYLSDNESVFSSEAATDLYYWLCACAQPNDEPALRKAMATPTLGLSLAQLDALNTREDVWEERLEQFRNYHLIWQRQGVLPMIRRLLLEFNVAARLLARNAASTQGGERRLTDILHLAELLQEASFTIEGEHALTRFMAEQMASTTGDAGNRRMRLESDADRVRVVTVHKSKGLEYPAVFIPFACAYRPVEMEHIPQFWHDALGDLQFTLTPDDVSTHRADRERMGEDIRKTYVALTRARHCTWLGLAPLKDNTASAIDYLLGTRGRKGSDYTRCLDSLAQSQAVTQLESADVLPDTIAGVQSEPAEALTGARQPKRAAREHWWIGSYSSLVNAGRGVSVTSLEDSALTENYLEAEQETETTAATAGTPTSATSPMHRFAKGAQAGSFLHELLEWAGREGFGRIAQAPDLLRDQIARRCAVRNWQEWIAPLTDWLYQVITTPLPLPGGHSVRLADLRSARPEMEFWLESVDLDMGQLDAAVCRHTLNDHATRRPGLRAARLNGLLKGFMDLVFEYQGRYYVMDYKSNWLGPETRHYTPEAMQQAIVAHRYDIQYSLYLFALHRLLRARCGDQYEYGQQMGGAVYLFLRGIEGEAAGVHAECPPVQLMDALEALFCGTQESIA